MTARHVLRRGVATAGSGALVLGAGLALGVTVADMAADWSARVPVDELTAAAQDSPGQGSAVGQVDAGGDALPARPRVVTRIVERHVTPEPVVVHRRVYRETTDSSRVTSPRSPRTPRTVPRPSRRAVAPAPAAPRPAPARAPSRTTSTAS